MAESAAERTVRLAAERKAAKRKRETAQAAQTGAGQGIAMGNANADILRLYLYVLSFVRKSGPPPPRKELKSAWRNVKRV